MSHWARQETCTSTRLVSERTVEENILKKANEKRLLGNVAIEGGNFTTAFFRQQTISDLFNEPSGLDALASQINSQTSGLDALASQINSQTSQLVDSQVSSEATLLDGAPTNSTKADDSDCREGLDGQGGREVGDVGGRGA